MYVSINPEMNLGIQKPIAPDSSNAVDTIAEFFKFSLSVRGGDFNAYPGCGRDDEGRRDWYSPVFKECLNIGHTSLGGLG